MSNLHNALAALERQQMLDRERAVVQDLHDRGICLGDSCIICREEAEKMKDLDHTLKQRGEEYGDYTNMAQVAQGIKNMMQHFGRNYAMLNYAQRESLDLIATKIARIVCGNPNNLDSWLDIEGYAKLARDNSPPPGGVGVGRQPPATP